MFQIMNKYWHIGQEILWKHFTVRNADTFRVFSLFACRLDFNCNKPAVYSQYVAFFPNCKKYGNARNSVCAEAVSSIVEYVNGIQTLRAYGMGGTRNKTITDILREYSQVSYKYEATGIPVSFFLTC